MGTDAMVRAGYGAARHGELMGFMGMIAMVFDDDLWVMIDVTVVR